MKKFIIPFIILISILTYSLSGNDTNTYTYEHPGITITECRWCHLDTLQAKYFDNREQFAQYYNSLIKYIACETGYDESFIFTYLAYETTNHKGVGGSNLWIKYNNPGGIKYHKGKYSDRFIFANDDCGDQPCKFSTFLTLRSGINAWINLLNSDRYKSCKGLSVFDTFRCFRDRGYHSSKRFKHRYAISKEYYRHDYKNNQY